MPRSPVSAATVEFGQRVVARRKALRLSQEQLAHASGLHWSTVSQIERGLYNTGLQNILKLAVGLQTDPGDLIRGMLPP
ncbi:MAG: helix-turn-helix domain-containing protein [Pseudonocardiaceae bacterium]|nr:helix-turn-helix domain-containing protein [Pseudonocardiaceae bacterium]